MGVFIMYALVVVVIEWRNLPSGSVQRLQQPAVHDHSNPQIETQITEMERQLALDPKNATLKLQFANLLHDARMFPRAIEAYKSYLQSVPDNHDARVDMGICYYETGDAAQAVREIESVIKASPRHQMAMFNLGVIQLSLQNMSESNKWLKRCIEIDPQSTAGQRARQILEQHQ